MADRRETGKSSEQRPSGGGGARRTQAPRRHRQRRSTPRSGPAAGAPAHRAAAEAAPGPAADRPGHRRVRRHRPGPVAGARRPAAQIIKILMGLGQMVTMTQSLSDEAVELIATEVSREVTIKHVADEEERARGLRRRGGRSRRAAAGRHDHGPRRPRQDDAARRDPRARVVETEAGGITQHIGAYQASTTAARSPSSTRRATRRSPRCAPAARR